MCKVWNFSSYSYLPFSVIIFPVGEYLIPLLLKLTTTSGLSCEKRSPLLKLKYSLPLSVFSYNLLPSNELLCWAKDNDVPKNKTDMRMSFFIINLSLFSPLLNLCIVCIDPIYIDYLKEPLIDALKSYHLSQSPRSRKASHSLLNLFH